MATLEDSPEIEYVDIDGKPSTEEETRVSHNFEYTGQKTVTEMQVSPNPFANNNDETDDNFVAPVIFAGVSSPGRLTPPLRQKRISKTSSTSGMMRSTGVLTATRASSTSPSRLSSTYTGNVSTPLPSEEAQAVPVDIDRLQAALKHSRAQERLLSESNQQLQQRLKESNVALTQRQEVLTMLTSEHRHIREGFRQLVDLAVEQKRSSGGSQETNSAQDAESHQDEVSSVATSRRRARSVPPESCPAANGGSQCTHQVEELLEALRGTNAFAQAVVKRNSALERRCAQLEADRDSQLRDLYNDFLSARTEKASALLQVDRLEAELLRAKSEMRDLHKEIATLNEKQVRPGIKPIELTDLKAQLADARETAARYAADLRFEKARWDAERQKLERDLSMQIKITNSSSTPTICDAALRERNSQLEEEAAELRSKLTGALEERESSIRSLQLRLREAETAAETARTAAHDFEQERDSIAERARTLRAALEAAEETARQLRSDLATAKSNATEVESLKLRLEQEQQLSESRREQVERQSRATAQANERFKELLDRAGVLDKLLEKQRHEAEALLRDRSKEREDFLAKFTAQREKYENALGEINTLRRRLAEVTDASAAVEEAAESAVSKRAAELRAERLRHTAELRRMAEAEIAALRQRHAAELVALRQTKQKQSEAVVQQYEKHLQSVKAAHEAQLKSAIALRDEESSKDRKEFERRVEELNTAWRTRLLKERQNHENELRELSKSLQESLTRELEKKTEEIQQLTRELNTHRAQLNESSASSERRVTQLKIALQQEWAAKLRDLEAAQEALQAKADHEHKEKIAAIEKEHKSAMHILKEEHVDKISAIERRLGVAESRQKEAEAEANKLAESITSRENEIKALRDQLNDAKTNTEFKQSSEETRLINALEKAREEIVSLRNQKTELEMRLQNEGEVDKLKESVNNLRQQLDAETTRWTATVKRLETDVLTKEEQLKLVKAAREHIDSLMTKTNRLEATFLKKEEELKASAAARAIDKEKYMASLAKLQAELDAARSEIETRGRESDRLKQELSDRTMALDRLKRELGKHEAALQRARQLEVEIESLRERLASAENQRERPAGERYHEIIARLNRNLIESEQKVTELSRRCDELRKDVGHTNQLSLEVALLKSQIESRNQTVDLLKVRAQKKQEIIDDLKQQLQSVSQETTASPKGTDAAALHVQITDLTKQLEELHDEKLSLTQQLRSLNHKMDLERQLAKQAVEEKDLQLRQLLETNTKAEILFTRNAELEEMLLRLTHELSVANEKPIAETVETTSEKRHTELVSESERHSEKDSSREMSQLLSQLQREVFQKDGEIHLLRTRIEKLKETHSEQTAILQQKLERRTVPTDAAPESDFLQMLVQKTADLQREVVRLQQEKYDSLLLPPLIGRVSVGGEQAGELELIQIEVERLRSERDSLLRELEIVRSSVETSTISLEKEVVTVREENRSLQNRVAELLRIVEQQRGTLERLRRQAEDAIRDNQKLRDIAEAIPAGQDESVALLELILARNAELERTIEELIKRQKSKRTNRTTTVHTRKTVIGTNPSMDLRRDREIAELETQAAQLAEEARKLAEPYQTNSQTASTDVSPSHCPRSTPEGESRTTPVSEENGREDVREDRTNRTNRRPSFFSGTPSTVAETPDTNPDTTSLTSDKRSTNNLHFEESSNLARRDSAKHSKETGNATRFSLFNLPVHDRKRPRRSIPTSAPHNSD